MFRLFHSKTRTKAHEDHKSRRKAEENAANDREYEQARKAENEAIQNANTATSATTVDKDIIGYTENNIPLTTVIDEDGKTWVAPYRNGINFQ